MSKDTKQKLFFTLVKPAEEDPYNRATTSMCWMSTVMLGENRHSYVEIPEGNLFVQRGRRKDYDKFTKAIEAAYPGRCKFDYKLR